MQVMQPDAGQKACKNEAYISTKVILTQLFDRCSCQWLFHIFILFWSQSWHC